VRQRERACNRWNRVRWMCRTAGTNEDGCFVECVVRSARQNPKTRGRVFVMEGMLW
jgi:hypothetical protein